MTIETVFGNFFKAETQSSGEKLIAQEKVSLSLGTDTSVHAYVNGTTPVRVVLSSQGVASGTILADCNCPGGKKASFCKHVWATLLLGEAKYPDFFAAKRVIEKAPTSLDPREAEKESYQEKAKARASEYRKAEYQKQKARAKGQKNEREGKTSKFSSSHPPEVETALAYFTLNGFSMESGISEEVLGEAKRKLSRIFHPDKGGSHEEVVELNTHWETLNRYLRG